MAGRASSAPGQGRAGVPRRMRRPRTFTPRWPSRKVGTIDPFACLLAALHLSAESTVGGTAKHFIHACRGGAGTWGMLAERLEG